MTALTISVPEAAEMLGISPWTYYEAAKRGDLPSLKIGRRILVPKIQLEEFVAGTWRSGS